MIYHAIGLMSGSSLDGLDIVFASFEVNGAKWSYKIIEAECIKYTLEWEEKLRNASTLSAQEYLLLHSKYGHFVGDAVNQFIQKNNLQYNVGLVGSHGHTSFHLPDQKMTAQLGDGAAISAKTGLSVVSDLRALDVALGGQGAPIVPIGEKFLFPQFDYFLNLGGIANLSIQNDNQFIAFDVCAANRVLNMLAKQASKEFDENGNMAKEGRVNQWLLCKLNELAYYKLPYPKSLSNSFGDEVVYPITKEFDLTVHDALCTYTEHIAQQIFNAAASFSNYENTPKRILITGGGAFNCFLMDRLTEYLNKAAIEVVLPDENTIKYKEALIMALIAVLRWREESNVLSSVTGAANNSIGGALWLSN